MRLPSYPRADVVEALLRHLDAIGSEGSGVLGYDEQGWLWSSSQFQQRPKREAAIPPAPPS